MGKIAFLFSGGGAQYPGMMQELYDNVPASRAIFEKADQAAGKKLSDLCFYGSQEKLNETSIMIPAVFTADLAAYAAIKEMGISPVVSAGFSLGEWAAITAAGVLPFEEAMNLIQIRAAAIAEATPKEGAGMAVIMGKPNEYVEELCTKVKCSKVYPANYNYPGQVTVSGTDAGLNELEEIAVSEGTAYKRLRVSYSSHCALMQPAMERLAAAMTDVKFASPSFPIISNATALETQDADTLKENIVIQLVHPVKFEQSVRAMLADGVDTFIELGPGKTLTGFVRKITKKLDISVSSVGVKDMETLEKAVEMCRA